MAKGSKQLHLEEYLYLPGLTHNSAIIAWGGFYFKVKGDPDEGKWEIVDDSGLPRTDRSRPGSIGVRAKPYGPQAKVYVFEAGTPPRQPIYVGNANYAWVRGLAPDTEYRYRVLVQDEAGNETEWGAGPLRDWGFKGERGGLYEKGGKYENRFRTFPAPDASVPDLTFAILGDFGRGVSKPSKGEVCQREIAETLRKAVDSRDVRLILTTGDNIYRGSGQGSGDEDDDWFFTYFQPYRYIINRVPVFASFGNHDEGESEDMDDRDQLYDNLYVLTHFTMLRDRHDSSIDPGLFYRVRYGSDIEFVCIDTSKKGLFGKRFFRMKNNEEFLDRAFSMAAPPRWRIPFLHHPPYCAGPQHVNKESVEKSLVPRFKSGGVRAVFSGHEHNFQHSRDAGVDYFVTGGAGKFRAEAPDKDWYERAKTQAWGGNDEGHFLLVEIRDDRMTITPCGNLAGGKLRSIGINVVKGDASVPPFFVNA
ncbi:MAG: metallophosphoesterase [Blastocatellia bacterium]|nr:metallophosphoesterase [Blastocatellia bacterium]